MDKNYLRKKIMHLWLCALAITSVFVPLISAPVYAQSDFYKNLEFPFYDPDSEVSTACDQTAIANPITPGNSTSGKSYTLDQVKTFSSEPVTSTWNISNSTVEQWFLKQSGAQATISKYGLNLSNIGDITSAVEAAKVSPVFFYLYVVNEGGGAGGFINHYGSDTAGGGPANAERDAEYLASQSQQTNGAPATGGGEPADMPTEDAQNILNSLPVGSIGVVYIQATSAVTAELEYLSGKTGDWNPGDSASPSTQFGSPLKEAMQNIQGMGGDPTQGGTSSCVTGQGMAKAISWAVMIANNDGYGYDQDTRTSGWAKWQSDPNCTHQCGSFDCSSFIAAALTEAGYFTTNPNFATGDEASELTGVGFKQVASSAPTSSGLLPGDVLLAESHTALYIGNNTMVAASINENGGVSGGEVGDQTGREVYVEPFNDHPWIGVFRAQN